MSEHSPGPWKWNDDRLYDSRGAQVSGLVTWVVDMAEGYESQNMKMIAAAPEMLELLRGWLDETNSGFAIGDGPSLARRTERLLARFPR